MKENLKWIIIFAVLCIVSAIVWIVMNNVGGEHKNAVIRQNGKIIKEIDLNAVKDPYEFEIKTSDGHSNTIRVEQGKIAIIDADGTVLGIYRKTHIPDDHYYQEKFYFTPGNTGFKVWNTRYAKIGVGICWDQWFPEAARCMAVQGAEILLYPTAIGSEPILEVDSMPHWRRCMQGHAACNIIPVVAANRIGEEKVIPCEANGNQESSLVFYGSSFVTDASGEIISQASRDREDIVYGESDLDENRDLRVSWGLFRDRLCEMYKEI